MEKRQFHRLLLKVEILHRQKFIEKASKSITRDISMGGICITTQEESLSIKAIYVLCFFLPGKKKPIKLKGRVVCIRKYDDNNTAFFDNGIEFIKPGKKFIKMIDEYSIGSINL